MNRSTASAGRGIGRLLAGVGVSTLAIITASPVWAQEAAAPTIESCQGITDEAARQDCLEAADPWGVQRSGEATAVDTTATPSSGDEAGIVVVGSRLRRTEFNSPDPIQVISPDLARARGDTDAAELLQNAPIAAGSTQVTAALSSNFVTDGGIGAQTLSLRGLGPTRTLVLLNGRRAGPAGTRGSVSSFDLNVLPLSVIQNVEVLKTGASSVYGSDAVAGVVNIKLREDLDGFEVGAFASPTEEGGGETYRLNAAWGKVFDRGHIMIAGDYYRREELQRRDRKYLNCTEDYVFKADGVTRADITNPDTGAFECNGTIGGVIATFDFIDTLGGDSNLFTPTGQAVTVIQQDLTGVLGRYLPQLAAATDPFGRDFSAPSDFYPVNYDGPSTGLLNQYDPRESQSSLLPKQDRYTVFASGSYDLTDNIEVFAEGLFNRRQTYVNGIRQIGVQQFTGSSYLPCVFGFTCTDEQLENGDFTLGGDPLNQEFSGDVILLPVLVDDHFDFNTRVDYYRGVLGARGGFGDNGFLKNWNWEAYGQFSRSSGKYKSDVLFQDSIDSQELRTGSCVGTTTAVRGVPCIDIDFTSPRVLAGQFTPEEQAFLFGTETGHTRYDQKIVEAFVSGPLFRLPGGDVQLGFGAQYRGDKINDVPGEETLRQNAADVTASGVTKGHSNTYEAFAEIELPLLKDVPFIQEFTLSAAGRVTNVKSTRFDGVSDSDKGNWTYKLGANWQVTDWLRFRGSYGTSFRSPALFEQFLSDETGFLDQIDVDPCLQYTQKLAAGLVNQRLADNCAAAGVPGNYTGGGTGSLTTITGGGIGVLDPETSRSWTASVVLTPPSLWTGMKASLAVDYFNIRVKGEVTQLGVGNIVSGCYNSEFFPNDPLCSQFERVNDPTNTRDNQILFVRDSFLNINRQLNTGVDVTGQLRQDLGNMGTLSLLAQMTWTLKDKFALFENTLADDNGEAGDPKWVGDFSLSWAKKPFTITYGLTAIGATSDRQDVADQLGDDLCSGSTFFGGEACPVYRLKAAFYHDLSVQFDVADDFEFTLGVANLTNRGPSRGSSLFNGIGPVIGSYPVLGSYYDVLGRRFFANVKAKF